MRTLRGHTHTVLAVAVSETMIVSGGEDALRLWSIADGVCLAVCTRNGTGTGGGPVTALALQGNILISSSVSHEHALQVWDLREQSFSRTTDLLYSHHVAALALRGPLLLAGGIRGFVDLRRLPC